MTDKKNTNTDNSDRIFEFIHEVNFLYSYTGFMDTNLPKNIKQKFLGLHLHLVFVNFTGTPQVLPQRIALFKGRIHGQCLSRKNN